MTQVFLVLGFKLLVPTSLSFGMFAYRKPRVGKRPFDFFLLYDFRQQNLLGVAFLGDFWFRNALKSVGLQGFQLGEL